MDPVNAWGNSPLHTVDPEIHHLIEKEKRRQCTGIELIASENFTSFAVIEAIGSPLTSFVGLIDDIETCAVPALFKLSISTPPNGELMSSLIPVLRLISRLTLPFFSPMTGSWGWTFLPVVNSQTGYIDHDKLEEKAMDFRPRLIICGGSAYPRDWDYARFRSVADKCGALLLCDMAHISGLVAAQEAANPFEVLPTNQIGALAVALKQAMTPGFKAYAKQVKANAVALGNYLMNKGYKLVTGGTENHLVLWDLRPLGLTGNKVEKLCDLCNITVNKNAVFGDSSALAPGGVRIGTPAMTSRGLVEGDFEQIGEFLHRAVTITLSIQKEHGKLLKDFNKGLVNNKDIEALKADVEKFASSFDMPGFLMSEMKYKN
ncbi:hypothetical protein GH714_023241 [Hevea brasiliensis]|uniref:glycine hydroxymethyltransferase n=1 Tax=Hevea brasiliensis TaxID=3981 RepID=A0A6A6KLU2_HEVBR|nr:hypothetical protein GH714_023241 [Hevea brasiliensis]